MNQQVLPAGVAVHTRGNKHGEDYGWYVRVGSTDLFSVVEELHRVALRDIEGQLPIAVLVKGRRVGFLVARMPSPREDHVQRLISDTLYLEFSSEDQATILKMVANLLTCSREDYEQYRQYFTEYAEELYKLGQEFLQNSSLSLIGTKLSIGENLTHLSAVLDAKELYLQYQSFLQTTVLPVMEDQSSILEPFELDKVTILPYEEEACQKCANYLSNFSAEESLCFVSTGPRITLEKSQPLTEMADRCIILTESSEIAKAVDSNKNLKQVVIDGFTKMRKFFKQR